MNFRTKLVWVISALVVGISLVALWRVESLSKQRFESRFAVDYVTARNVTQRVLGGRLDLLEQATVQMSRNPRILAAVSTGDRATVQDLITDEAEGFQSIFRAWDLVLLYGRSPVEPNDWIAFDHYGVRPETAPVKAILSSLEQQFAVVSEQNWQGLLMFRNGRELFIASAAWLPTEQAILVFGERLSASLAEDLRGLTLDAEDHLAFFYGRQLVCSTMSTQTERWFSDQIEAIPHSEGPAQTINLPHQQDSYTWTSEFTDLDMAILPAIGNPQAGYLMLKSRRSLDREIAELRKSLIFVGLLGLVAAILISGVVAGGLARPVQELASFVSRVGDSDLEQRLSPDRYKGELRQLARAFDGMQLSLLEKNRQLVESERFYRTLIENSSQAICGLDADSGRIFAANASFQQLTRYGKTELDDLIFEDFFFTEERQDSREILRELTENRLVSRETRLRQRDGGELFVDLKLSMVDESPGTHALVILSDETEKKKLEQQLMQSQKMDSIGTLAGGVAHDFNNLLTAIIGFALLARQDTAEDDQRYDWLLQIERAGEQAAMLTRNLLAFGRRSEMRPKPIMLNDVVKQAERFLSRTFDKIISLQCNLAKSLDIVKADDAAMQQIVMNLCINARDAMPEGGTITVETANVYLDEDACKSLPEASPGAYVRLSVIDTGTGIDPETLQKIFEPFFTTKDVGKGTGLGLSIVYGIISTHHGILDVQSRPGAGTSFHIYLPVISSAEEKTKEVKATADGGCERILLVDDDEVILKLGCHVLQAKGYEVVTSVNGKDALARLQANEKFDLVIIDMVMPVMSGRQLFDCIKADGYEVDTLIASGYSLQDSAQGMLERGASGFLQKPYRPEDLAARVREILDART